MLDLYLETLLHGGVLPHQGIFLLLLDMSEMVSHCPEFLDVLMKPKDLSLVFGDLGPLSLGLVLEPLPLGLVDPDGLALPLLLLLLFRLLHVAREVGSDIDPVLEPVHLPRDLGQILVENAVYLLCIMLRQLVGQRTNILDSGQHNLVITT